MDPVASFEANFHLAEGKSGDDEIMRKNYFVKGPNTNQSESLLTQPYSHTALFCSVTFRCKTGKWWENHQAYTIYNVNGQNNNIDKSRF